MNNIEQKAWDWLEGNQLSYDIWCKKYRYDNESFDEWLTRVSNNDTEVKDLILNKRFIFGGRILANRGLQDKQKVTFSNCYVIPPVEDNIEGIYKACSQLARTYSYGGGCGIDISNLRPAGAKVNNSAKTTSGAVSFMSTFDEVTKVIGQNGRRAALMISIDINHPDVQEFINIKANTDKVTSANISIRVNDDFMKAVVNNENYVLRWPCNYTFDDYDYQYFHSATLDELHEVSTSEGEVKYYWKLVDAAKLFHTLCENNWNYAEPGILYWDRINNYNLLNTDENFSYAGVNPCAEEPLPAGGSCLLGSLNLASFIKDEEFDIDSFRKTIPIAIKALNDVLLEGLYLHPLDVQKQTVNDYRQIGLGIMGLADLFIKLKIPYGSLESVTLSTYISNTLASEAILASNKLAKDKKYGKYPKFTDEIYKSNFFTNHITANDNFDYSAGMANSQLLTIAPTGSISTMWNISGGIEPMFAKVYTRMTKSLNNKDSVYTVYPKIVKEYMDSHSLISIEELPEWFVSSEDISPSDRVMMQAVWQSGIDASISSTVNLPEKATIEDVKYIYLDAWRGGLKGITVFRSNCARQAILKDIKQQNINSERQAPKRPKVLEAMYHQVKVKGEQFIVLVGLYENKPYEVFAFRPLEEVNIKEHKGTITKNGKMSYSYDSEFINIANLELSHKSIEEKAVTLNASMALRHGIEIKHIVKIIKKVNENISSFSSALCRILSRYMPKELVSGEQCPDCGGNIIRENGCKHCDTCGWSACG